MKEKLNKKLAPAEESHHVGGMDPNEVAPTVWGSPELVMETETTAFERPGADKLQFLKDNAVLCKDWRSKFIHFHEVDSQGKRTLPFRARVVKESIPEITKLVQKFYQAANQLKVWKIQFETPKRKLKRISGPSNIRNDQMQPSQGRSASG